MRTKLLVLLLLFVIKCMGHPGTGIVADRHGNVYYTDLRQVWKITKSGHRSVAVPGVHTHELYMDAQGDLYGEHMWYNGEKLNTFGSYAWCLRANGKLDTVKGPIEGFLEDYSFARDGSGNQYWVERFTSSRIKRKSPDGTITTIAEGNFRNVTWMHVTPEGIVYFVDRFNVYQVKEKKSSLLAALAPPPKSGDGRHSIFGIWTDNDNNLYAAVSDERKIKKVSVDGKISVMANSGPDWAPSGGVFDREGKLWVLEFNDKNEIRVRRIDTRHAVKKKEVTTSEKLKSMMPLYLTAGLLATCLLVLKRYAA